MELTSINNGFSRLRSAVEFTPVAMESAVRDPSSRKSDASDSASRDREDTLTLSPLAQSASPVNLPLAVQNDKPDAGQRQNHEDSEQDSQYPPQDEDKRDNLDSPADNNQTLSQDELRIVQEMRQTDQRVRAHEQAHASAGAHNVRYEYETGPDGRQYAVAGTADIEIFAPADDPAAKIAQAQKMRAAALAPADPSGQDLAVAAKASSVESAARKEMANLELDQMVVSSGKGNHRPFAEYL